MKKSNEAGGDINCYNRREGNKQYIGANKDEDFGQKTINTNILKQYKYNNNEIIDY